MTYVWKCKRNLAVAKNVNIPPTPPPPQWQEEHRKEKNEDSTRPLNSADTLNMATEIVDLPSYKLVIFTTVRHLKEATYVPFPSLPTVALPSRFQVSFQDSHHDVKPEIAGFHHKGLGLAWRTFWVIRSQANQLGMVISLIVPSGYLT